MNVQYIECDCHSEEHTLRYHLDEEDGELYTTVYLQDWEAWHKRLWKAAKYVFGYSSKWGHFDTTVMSGDNLYKLRDLCERAIKINEGVKKNGTD
jgi:hypothetical protein